MDFSYLTVPQLKKIAKGYGLPDNIMKEKDKERMVGGMKKCLRIDKEGMIHARGKKGKGRDDEDDANPKNYNEKMKTFYKRAKELKPEVKEKAEEAEKKIDEKEEKKKKAVKTLKDMMSTALHNNMQGSGKKKSGDKFEKMMINQIKKGNGLSGGRKYKKETINQINPVLTGLDKKNVLNPANPISLAYASPNFVKPYMQNKNINNPLPAYSSGDMTKKDLIHVQGGSHVDVSSMVFGGFLKNEETMKILKHLVDNKDKIKKMIEKRKKK